MNDSDILSAFTFSYLREKKDFARIRTWNPLIRSQMPYSMDHGAVHSTVYFFLNFLYIMLTIIYTFPEEQDCSNKTVNHS